MYGPSSGLLKDNKSSQIKLMKNHINTNNSIEGIDKIKLNKSKDLKENLYISKKTYQKPYSKKMHQYIAFHQNYNNYTESRNLNKAKTPKNPLLIPKQDSIQINNYIEKYSINNYSKFDESISKKNYVSSSFSNNVKKNYKGKNIKLSLNNSNSNQIKLQANGIKNAQKNKQKNKKNILSNSSMDIKASTSTLFELDSLLDKMQKNSSVIKKNSKIKSKFNNNYNNNYNPEIGTFISYTLRPFKKNNFMKSKVSASNNFDDIRRKEEIKMIFEREFEKKMNHKKPILNNNNNSSLMTKYSRNNKSKKNKNFKNSQSQKNINSKNKIYKKKLEMGNAYKRKTNENIVNKSNFSYGKYYILLEEKINKLNKEIENLKNEEKNLQMKLINYKEKETQCIVVRKMREEIKKYKNIIEMCSKACEEYSLEIKKITDILGKNGIINDKNADNETYNINSDK